MEKIKMLTKSYVSSIRIPYRGHDKNHKVKHYYLVDLLIEMESSDIYMQWKPKKTPEM